jgi:hypothetical protein
MRPFPGDGLSPSSTYADCTISCTASDPTVLKRRTSKKTAYHCVEFGYRMAEQALEFDLRRETEFLVRYDRVLKAVNERFDVRGSDPATLVVCCLDNGGKLSKNRRKQFTGRVPEAVFDYLEQVASELSAPGQDGTQPDAQADNNVDQLPGPG